MFCCGILWALFCLKLSMLPGPGYVFFSRLGNFLVIISSSKFSVLFLSLPSGIPLMRMSICFLCVWSFCPLLWNRCAVSSQGLFRRNSSICSYMSVGGGGFRIFLIPLSWTATPCHFFCIYHSSLSIYNFTFCSSF